MKHVVIGTAGHIDHGKTVLTRALTGIDTDRLPEEKEREMSIDLGFAPFPLKDDLLASIVDVPGHEKFVKNMVAGVSGVDLILLVIAADDGVMPQTKEHLQILQLLGLKHGVVVITKLDLVSPERLESVKTDIQILVSDTFLEDAPIVAISSVDGTNLPDLKKEIERIAERVELRRSDHIFRLPVDRVFTIAGFGTVITGTLISGSVNAGQEVEILPQRRRARVRAIQTHQSSIEKAVAGQRTALNLKDVGKQQLARGDVVTTPRTLSSTKRIDVKLSLLDTVKKPLKHMTRVRFHVGTSEIMARVGLLSSKELPPGHETFAQIRPEKPIVTLRGDRFILRSYSPQSTIGGGVVLDAYPVRHRLGERRVLKRLQVLSESDEKDVIDTLLSANTGPMTKEELVRRVNIPERELDHSLSLLQKEGRVVLVKNQVVHSDVLAKYEEEFVGKIDSEFRDRVDISRGEFRQALTGARDALTSDLLLRRLEGNRIVKLKGDRIELLTHADSFSGTRSSVESLFRESGFKPPSFADVSGAIGAEGVSVRDLLRRLVDDGVLVQVAPGMAFHKEILEKAIAALKEHMKSNRGITVSDFRKLVDTSRKYAVPLLEYLDSKGITVRDGDIRTLRS